MNKNRIFSHGTTAMLVFASFVLFVVFADEAVRLVTEVSVFNQVFDPNWGISALIFGLALAAVTVLAFTLPALSRRQRVLIGGFASFVSACLLMESLMDGNIIPFAFWSILIAIPPMTCGLVIGPLVLANPLGCAD